MIKITPAMVRRYNSKRLGIYDPCIICGGEYLKCPHLDDTPELIKRIKELGAAGRKKILDAEK